MTRPSASNGRPEPEVILNFSDAEGVSYSKTRLEEAFRAGGLLEKNPPKAAGATSHGKREDVDLIVHEFEITRQQAEKVLAEHGGNVTKALEALITPKSL